MAQRTVAIDMGHSVARIAVVDASLRQARLVEVKTLPVDPALPAAERWALVRAALVGEYDSTIVALDARNASARQIRFPFTDLKKAEAAVQFELEGQIPFAIDDVAISWQLAERRDNDLSLLTAIIPKATLAAQLAALREGGLEPRAMMHPAAALAEYVPETDARATAVISLGDTLAHVALCRKGLRFVRTLKLGGDLLDAALARHFAIVLKDARALKEAEGGILVSEEDLQRVAAQNQDLARAREISDVLKQALTPLLTAMVATFKSLEPEDMPTRLLLTGGSSRLPGLDSFVALRLGIEVELLDVAGGMAKLEDASTMAGPEYAVALGMAQALFGHGSDIALNFRRGEFGYHGDIQLYRGQLLRVAVGLALVFGLALLTSVTRFVMLHAEEREIDTGFCVATERIVGKRICQPTMALAALRQTSGENGVNIPSYSATRLLEMMSKLVLGDVDVHLDEIDLRVDATPGQPERITAKGEAASFEAIELLSTQLRRDPCVQEAEVSKQRKAQSGSRVEFNLRVMVLCPVGVVPGSNPVVAKRL